MYPKSISRIGIFSLSLALAATAAWASIDTKKLSALKPRSIGPASMSGRVTTFAVDPRDSKIIYAGSASGGAWKSLNAGLTWEPIFDDQGSASIGAIAVDPFNPDVIWIGAGEGNPRNSQNIGDGIYKSLDGGHTWTKLGLESSEHIHRILIHPRNTDTVYVAAVGPTWSDGEERGVFKTTDGGKTWAKVLYVDQRTGCADLVMDASNPDKLFAAMWEHRRTPWDFKSGGPGSGLYVTFDGGLNWVKRSDKDGLPAGDLGRMGLGIAPSNPNVVYALIESKKNALYRSDDGGFKWRMINDKSEIGNRPFYYFDIRVHPTNENTLYSLHSGVTYSEDGGKSFSNLTGGTVHPDHHAFWIDPQNPNFMLDGNDGGMYVSHDAGKNWRFVENLPLGQFYHVNVDMDIPYNIYGGLQDNGSYAGPSRVWQGGGFSGAGGILNQHWQMLSFGDGFDVVPDPTNSRFGYSMSQGGNLYRFDRQTGNTKSLQPVHPDGTFLRFNWNAAIFVEPDGTVYYGSQFVHRSEDRGDTWEIISPDLTTNDPERQKQLDSGGLTYDVTGAENNATIVSIAASSAQKGVIWVGTDDGYVQLTRDNGKTWTNVTANIDGFPAGSWVPHVEASTHDAGTAFVVVDDHRRGNMKSYAYKTTDFGQTWTSLITEGIRGNVFVIEQDPVAADLLFLGTEFHLYFSIDGGSSWTKWDQGYPTAPTRDLVVHPRDGDLVVATFGRSFYVFDDISVLRAMAQRGEAVLSQPLELHPIPAAYAAEIGVAPGVLFPGEGVFRGDNPRPGAMITYVANPPEKEAEPEGENVEAAQRGGRRGAGGDKAEVKVEILSGDQVIRTLKGPAEPGVNRMFWSLDRKGVRFPSFGGRGGGFRRQREDEEPGGIPVLPGEYKVRVSLGELSSEQSVTVRKDPRFNLSDADMKARSDMYDEYLAVVEQASATWERLEKAKEAMDRITDLIKDRKDDEAKAVQDAAKSTSKAWTELKEMFSPAETQGFRRDPNLVTSKLFGFRGQLSSSWDKPNDTEKTMMRQLKEQMGEVTGKVDAFFEKEWQDYKKAVLEAEISLID